MGPRGLTSETVWALIGFGFEKMNLNRIEARCNAENVASAGVLKKAVDDLRRYAKAAGVRQRRLPEYEMVRHPEERVSLALAEPGMRFYPCPRCR